ncbi:hypothetical protein [Nodularia sphaerocarpa]|uniref:hypothetical protein n=1 Tax=Nodularia sphaerocarpa TaxID=137816 RepID=UPI001EFC15F0|nr:hypothetical protein [Nodularia sphaerocarpa]MDB9372799.1 hypothetical protein [Nodularia sphaerocarpa CS-585]ULP74163.1 hypothetical protein BDGGKGIB_03826 [Nodularia sphaerocarpa UHCC 0038]
MNSAIAERSGIIWTPPDLIDLLAVSIDGHSSPEEFQGMLRINQAARDLLTGKMLLDTYLDFLEYEGMTEPQEIWNEAVQHVGFLRGESLF